MRIFCPAIALFTFLQSVLLPVVLSRTACADRDFSRSGGRVIREATRPPMRRGYLGVLVTPPPPPGRPPSRVGERRAPPLGGGGVNTTLLSVVSPRLDHSGPPRGG